jgi:hypothetical protein
VGGAWRERLLTALLVVVIAVPVGIVIGGGLDFGGGAADAGAGDEVLAGAAGSTTTSSTTTSTTEAPASTTTTVASRPPAEVKVRFANGSHTAGAAVTVGDRLAAAGYTVLAPGPSPKDPVAATTVTFRDGFAAEGAAVAAALGLAPSVATPGGPALGGADVAGVVGDDVVAPKP